MRVNFGRRSAELRKKFRLLIGGERAGEGFGHVGVKETVTAAG